MLQGSGIQGFDIVDGKDADQATGRSGAKGVREMRRDDEPDAKREMTVAEAGKKGGERVKAKYGKEFYSEIGHKGGQATREKYGPEFYGEIGKKGGQTTAEKHGPEFFERIGKKGGQRVRELIERGKQNPEK
jgi:general stress protein YciG